MPATDSIASEHPSYSKRICQWERCRDCWEGQDAIKEAGHKYLPPSEGMVIDGAFTEAPSKDNIGWSNYQAYLGRALFYGYFADAVQMGLGLAWTKDPIFEGISGTPLEYLLTRATHEGESLSRLLYRINEAQMTTGRIGLFADMPKGETFGKPQPYIACYAAESALNWDAGRIGEMSQETLNLVVLNETGPARTGTFEYDELQRYRVLTLGPVDSNEPVGVYRQGLFEEIGANGTSGTPMFSEDEMWIPTIQGRKLDEIPFVFINATNVTTEPVDPPLLSLADLVLALYRVSADYNQELHNSTQATLVTKGLKPRKPGEKRVRLGAGSFVELGDTATADAWFLELSGKGLPALKDAVNDLKNLCSARAGEIIDTSSRGRESGNAMEQRISVRTANLHAIVQTGALGLERLLKIMGKWLGMSAEAIEKIKVIPNTVFSKPLFQGVELKQLVESKLLGGAAISLESIHRWLTARGYTQLSFEEMVQQVEQEKSLLEKLRPPEDPSKAGGSNGGPKILPSSGGV